MLGAALSYGKTFDVKDKAPPVRITIASENALMIRFGNESGAATSARIQAAATLLRTSLGGVLTELVPGFTTLLVIYEPLSTEPLLLRRRIANLLAQLEGTPPATGKLLELPVYYNPETGPDLERIARHSGLTIEEVIHCHSSRDYRVLAIGFAPGFAYLSELDERLALPRLASPRLKVPRGAVAIANRQTAVYPQSMPGGWNLIGLCPTQLFKPTAKSPLPFSVGDRVRFVPIDRKAFLDQGGEL